MTIEGISFSPYVEALAPGEGFIVRLSTSWNTDRETRRLAEQEGLLGQRLNVHKATFAEARTAIDTAIGDFVTDVQAFISENSA